MNSIIALIVIATIPLWGYFVLKNRIINPAVVGWVLTIGLIAGIHFYIPTGPLLLMLLYIMSTFLSMKIVVAHNRLKANQQLNFIQWLLFCYAWFGMNPLPFTAFPARPYQDYRSYLLKGFSRIIIGLLLINGISLIVKNNGANQYLISLIYLVSLSLILHFGLLNIAAGNLRWLGIPVTSLFKDPIKSKSLQEFWSRRWNIAFVELTTLAVLRPLRKRIGATAAFWASFVFSGLLHELAISLPVNSGYGKPFAYFIIQALLIVTIEKYVINKLSVPWIKTVWVLTCLFLPIFILFHEKFIAQVIMPLANYLTFV